MFVAVMLCGNWGFRLPRIQVCKAFYVAKNKLLRGA